MREEEYINELLIEAISNLNSKSLSSFPEYWRWEFKINMLPCRQGTLDFEMTEDFEEETTILQPYWGWMLNAASKTPIKDSEDYSAETPTYG